MHGRVADLGVDDVLGGQVLDELGGDALEVGGLGEGAVDVGERLQEVQEVVEVQCTLELLKRAIREVDLVLAGEVQDRGGTNGAFQVEVQLGLRQGRDVDQPTGPGIWPGWPSAPRGSC